MNNYLVTEKCSDLRRAGRACLKGKWGTAILAVFLFFVLTEGVRTIPFAGGVWNILATGALTFGLTGVFVAISRGVATKGSNVFKGFNFFGKALGLFWFQTLFILLWSLLLVIPGIIAAIRYSQAYYIMVDDPSKEIRQCMDESKAMMKGNLWKYFKMDLSFIGWILLAAIVVSIPLSILAGMGVIEYPMAESFYSDAAISISAKAFVTAGAAGKLSVAMMLTEYLTILVMIPLMTYIYSTNTVFYNILKAGCESCRNQQQTYYQNQAPADNQ